MNVKRIFVLSSANMAAALTAACAEPPVKPIPEAAGRSVTAVSADVSGVKTSNTSKLGARGSGEGGRLGALQGAAAAISSSGGGLLGLVLAPVGAAVEQRQGRERGPVGRGRRRDSRQPGARPAGNRFYRVAEAALGHLERGG